MIEFREHPVAIAIVIGNDPLERPQDPHIEIRVVTHPDHQDDDNRIRIHQEGEVVMELERGEAARLARALLRATELIEPRP